MYPLRRIFFVILRVLLREKPIAIHDCVETPIWCMPWDLDIFFEMNNGRVLTLFDIGRLEFALRSGLVRALIKNKWGLVVAGSSIRYRKRIRLFDRVTMKTQLIGVEGRWCYLSQTMWVRGEAACSVLLRTGITRAGRVIDSAEVFPVMDITMQGLSLPEWAKAWAEADALRPWPPEP